MHKRVWLGLFMFVLAGIGLLDLGKTPEQRMNEQIENRTRAVGELQAKAEAVRYSVNAPGFYDHDPVAGIISVLISVGLGTWAVASAAKRSTPGSSSAEKVGPG